jgi:CheY-like chemotaxis protein
VFWESFNLKGLVAEIGPLIQSAIPKQIRLVYDLQNVPPIKGAPVQVQQVIMNLIINAGQAILEQSPGEIRVRTSLRMMPDPNSPEAGNLSPGAYVTLEVEDTGRGMDKQTVERIFDPFFTTKVSGKGLGLATVRGIVRDHGGVIWVRSAPGRGTCFTVLFPAASDDVKEDGRGDAAEQPRKRGRVLVVEDEPLVQRMAKMALEAVGHTVVVLTDGRDADSLMSSPTGEFDVVILDLGIPGMSAINLIRRIQEGRTKARVVVFSGQPEQEVRRILQGTEVFDVLAKPCTPAQLRDTVRKALG